MTLEVVDADLALHDGQSLVLAPDLTLNYPTKMAASLTRTLTHVSALTATTWVERTVDVGGRVDSWLKSVTGTKTLIDCGGTRNINQGQTAAAIMTEMETYWNARLLAGFDHIVACTVNNATDFTGGELTVRTALNNLILASSVPDAVADLAAIPELANPANATYFSDGVHFTSAATTLCAPVVLAAYQAALAT